MSDSSVCMINTERLRELGNVLSLLMFPVNYPYSLGNYTGWETHIRGIGKIPDILFFGDFFLLHFT